MPNASFTLSWPIHDQRNTSQGNYGTHQIKAVWHIPIEYPTPHKRQDNKKATIGSVDPSEVGRLKRRDDSIKNQDYSSDQSPKKSFPLPKPLTNEPATTDLT